MEIHRRPNHIIAGFSGGFLQPDNDLDNKTLAFDNTKLQSDFLVLKQKIILTDSLISSYTSCKSKYESITKEFDDLKIQHESLNKRYGNLLQKHISDSNELEECKKTIQFLQKNNEVAQIKAKASELLVDQLNAHLKNIESKIKENDITLHKRKLIKSIDTKISKTSPKKKSTIEKLNQSLLHHVIVFGEKAKFANALSTLQIKQLENFKQDALNLNISIDYFEEISENLDTGPPSCCSADSGLSQDDPKFDINISENTSTCSDYSKTSDSESYNKININNRIKSYLDQVTSTIVVEMKSVGTSPLKLKRSLSFGEEEIKNNVDSSTYVTEKIIDSEYLKEEVTDEEVNEILMKIKGTVLLREISPIPSDDETKYSPVKKKVVKNKFRKEMKRKLVLKKRSFFSLIEALKSEMKMNRHFLNKKIMKLENNITEITDKHKKYIQNLELSQDTSNTPFIVQKYKDVNSCPSSGAAKHDKFILDASDNCQIIKTSDDDNSTNISNSSNILENNCDILNMDSLLSEENPNDFNTDFDSEKSDILPKLNLSISEKCKTLSSNQFIDVHTIKNKINNPIDVPNNFLDNNSDEESKIPQFDLNQIKSSLKDIENKDDIKNESKTKELIHVDMTKLNLEKEKEKEFVNTTNRKNASKTKKPIHINETKINPEKETDKEISNITDSKNVSKTKELIHINETKINLENEKEIVNTTNNKNVSEIKQLVSNSKVIETNSSKIKKNVCSNKSKAIDYSELFGVDLEESDTNMNTDFIINRSLKRKKCLTPIDISAKKCKNDRETPKKINTNTEDINDLILTEKNSLISEVSTKKRVSHFIKDATAAVVSYSTLNKTESIEKAKSVLAKLNTKTAIVKPKVFLKRITRKNVQQNADGVNASYETTSEPETKHKIAKVTNNSSKVLTNKTNVIPVVLPSAIEENKSFNADPVVNHKTDARKILSYEELDVPTVHHETDARKIVSYDELDVLAVHQKTDTRKIVTYTDFDDPAVHDKTDSRKIESYEDFDDSSYKYKHHILTQFILKHLNNCQKLSKKQLDAYENDCKKILKILEETLNSTITKISLDELTQKLEPYTEKLIAHSLILYISEARSCETVPVLLPRMPVMSYHHQSALCFMQKLHKNPPGRFTKDIFELVMDNIEYKLFQLNNTPKTDVSEQLSSFFAILCFATKQKERLKVFCMDALYCMSFKSISVIASAMQVWPRLFPRIDDNLAKDPLVIVMMHLITSICNKDKFKVKNLSTFILKNYGYRGGEFNDDGILEMFKKIIINKEHHLLKRSSFMALLLFGKRCGATWCYKNILLDFLLPILDDNYATPECKLFVAELIGPLSRPFPTTMTMQREIIREKLNMALKKEAAPVIQEAIVRSMISLSNRCFHRIVQDIIKWQPTTPISQQMEKALWNLVKEKPPKFWKNNASYIRSQT